jgi:hypothetical protein
MGPLTDEEGLHRLDAGEGAERPQDAEGLEDGDVEAGQEGHQRRDDDWREREGREALSLLDYLASTSL